MQLNQMNLEYMKPTSIWLHNVELQVSHNMESAFKQYLRKLQIQEMGTDKNLQEVQIRNREIQVYANNTWMDLYKRSCQISLNEPNTRWICESDQSHVELRNYMAVPNVALTFRVVYLA